MSDAIGNVRLFGSGKSEVGSTTAENLTDTTRHVSALLIATADMDSEYGTIERHRQDTESKEQCHRNVGDTPPREMREEAMQREFKRLAKNGTFTPVELLMGRKIVGAKWIYPSETYQHGEVIRSKVRLVDLLGDLHPEGVDYLDTLSLITLASSIPLMASLAPNCDWDSSHLEIQHAFVQPSLE